MEDYEAYFAHARMLTRIYALPKPSKTTGDVRKQPLQVSNVNVDTDLPVISVRSSLELISSPDTPYRSARPLLVEVDFGPASPRICGSRSPFVGSPVKAKRFKSSMRRL
jgi:hypothetical protein